MKEDPKEKPETSLVPTGKAGPLAPIPPSIEEEARLAQWAAEENLARMALVDPDKVEKALNALAKVMKTMREIAIQDTVGIDWTLYRDSDGREVAVMRDSGAVKARKWLGISITGHRPPDGSGAEGPRVYLETVDEGGGKSKKVQVVDGIADGYCARTGERIEAVYFAVRNEPKEFTGRKHPVTKLSNLTDLLSTWRTGIDAKIVRILGGIRKVPKEDLSAYGVDVTKCYLGHGYGAGAERAAAGAAVGELGEQIAALRKSVIRRTAGDLGKGKVLVREITSSPKTAKSKGFAGVDSLDQLTLTWQIDRAWKNLRAHPKFGNRALGWPEDAEDPPENQKNIGDESAQAPEENGTREPGEES